MTEQITGASPVGEREITAPASGLAERTLPPDDVEARSGEGANEQNGTGGTTTRFGDVRDELGTRVVRRTLKTADVWYVIRILGRVSKDARERVLASDGNMDQMDIAGLLLTEGVDKAQEEINAWFGELTGVPAHQVDSADIGFYMDVLEDLDTVGIEGFLGRLIPWYRKKFGDSGRSSSPSELTGSAGDTAGETTR